VYYLNIIKEIFFYKPEYKINSLLKDRKLLGYIYNNNGVLIKNLEFKYNNIIISNHISIKIYIITLIILLFIFINKDIYIIYFLFYILIIFIFFFIIVFINFFNFLFFL